MARTRIVATLGPATSSEAKIAELIDAGVSVFRLNFSHGTHEEHGRLIDHIRARASGRPVAILQDLCGPKLRLAHAIRGKPGDIVSLPLPADVRAGDPVLLADGLMQLEVIDATRSRVVVGGDIPARKGINLPSSRLDDVPALTDKDRADLRFGLDRGVDFVALSFVRRAADLDEVRASGVPVIAKIEKAAAVERIAEIVRAADGIMVARGDLGVEIPIEQVPLVQKKLIALANQERKPVITATQMLRSMVDSRMPTRAEATDVANAVLDGTDAVMLSEETAVGKYPTETVRIMERILAATEPNLASRDDPGGKSLSSSVAAAACRLAADIRAAAIIVVTRSGFTARQVAGLRPPMPILAITNNEVVPRRLALVWGIISVTAPFGDNHEDILGSFRDVARASGIVRPGDPVVVVAGYPFAQPGITNLIHAATV
jgi:pyruvate kinase